MGKRHAAVCPMVRRASRLHLEGGILVRLFRLHRLDSIKSRILVFALLAAFLPSVTLGSLYYAYTKHFLQGKIVQEMRNINAQAAQEIEAWYKERLYDIRVFSDSPEVSENLEKIVESTPDKDQAITRLTDYLTLIIERFVDYHELMIADPTGRVAITTSEESGTITVRPGWHARTPGGETFAGYSYWDSGLQQQVMIIAVPIRDGNGLFLGLFGAKLNLQKIHEILKTWVLGDTEEICVIDRTGTVVSTSRSLSLPFDAARLEAETPPIFFEKEGVGVEFMDHRGARVVGVLERLSDLDLGLVTTIGKKVAYAQITKLRTFTVLVVSILLLAIGLTAYFLGLAIVRPLARLTKAAAKVTGGSLDVDLPDVRGGEVASLTEVFKTMVVSLRKGREELAAANQALREKNDELKEISITDDLTGLHNRKHLMETLDQELARAQRYDHPFSMLMIDIDHFKAYNDTFGHLAGDRALARIASVFVACVRRIDYVARYGGEEFVIILPETKAEAAVSVAKRIRTRVAATKPRDDADDRPLTVSIGVAGFPECGGTPESIIAGADTALYQAKGLGRNRVACSHSKGGQGEAARPPIVH
jgi:diguanylate cyclase (GGDEF)-like protein